MPAAEPGTALVLFIGPGLADILCEHHERTVGRDNCVRFERTRLQIPAQAHRCHFIKARVQVHRYPDRRLAVFHRPRNEVEIQVARASLFAAQVLARELIELGHEHEIEEIRQFISTIVPAPDGEPHPAGPSDAPGASTVAADPGPFRPGPAGLIERTFRYSCFLATLERDEMLAEGHKADVDRMVAAARKLQAKVLRPAEE